MRVGLLCHSSLGGSARVATELAVALAGRGHSVHLFARSIPVGLGTRPPGLHLHLLGGQSPASPPFTPSGDLDVNWSGGDMAALGSLLERVIVSERIDVLHYHYAMPFALVAANLRARLGPSAPAVVGTLHGTDVTVFGRHAVAGPPLAAAVRAADRVTTVSHDHARLSAEVFRLSPPGRVGVEGRGIRVIPNSVDLRRFHPDVAAWAWGPPTRPWRVAHVSNFRPIKDPAGVSRIFLRLCRRFPAELWLVGAGSELPAALAVLREGGAGDRVRCWGFREDVSELLRRADLLLMASEGESFCLAALEAMACGVPVLATDVGGLPETVGPGRGGLLYPLGDLEEAERLAANLLSDPRRHLEMRHEAVRQARRFDHERVVLLYESVYREALAQFRGSAPGGGRDEA